MKNRTSAAFGFLLAIGFGLQLAFGAAVVAPTITGAPRYTGVVKTTPVTTNTVTFAATQQVALIVPAGTIAALTLTLPACAAANDGDERYAIFSQIVTTLTTNAAAGSVVGNPAAAAVGISQNYHCYGADTTWYRM